MTDQNFSLVFTKKFTFGLLEGLTYGPEFISFPSLKSRTNWLRGVKANSSNGSIDWAFEGDILFYENISKEEATEDYKIWQM